jgi:hypothetical protein
MKTVGSLGCTCRWVSMSLPQRFLLDCFDIHIVLELILDLVPLCLSPSSACRLPIWSAAGLFGDIGFVFGLC